MSGDLIVASFEVDKESSSFGFPFCAQVRKYFTFVFASEEFQGKQPRVKDFHFYPDPAKSFISQPEAEKFFAELNSIFHVSCEFYLSYQKSFSHFLAQLLVSWTFR